MIMLLVLQRDTPAGAARTFGRLLAEDGQQLCFTLEDPVRELAGQPVDAWKIKGETAIPAGRYQVTLEHSPRFGPETLTVHRVPGFVGVRIHAGNTVDDTEGCPLLGTAINEHGIVGGTSRPAVSLVKHVVRMALDRGERVFLDVRNASAAA